MSRAAKLVAVSGERRPDFVVNIYDDGDRGIEHEDRGTADIFATPSPGRLGVWNVYLKHGLA